MKQPSRIAIVENELQFAEGIMSDLRSLDYEVVEPVCKAYETAVAMLPVAKPDLVLIDIELGGIKTGIDFARYLNAHYPIPFIFLTSHLSHGIIEAVKAVRPEAIITKPFLLLNLHAKIQIALFKQEALANKTELVVKETRGTTRIPIADILYIEADRVYTRVVLSDREFTLRKTLKELLAELPEGQFVQVHRSFVVNRSKVLELESTKVILEGCEVARRWRKAFNGQ